MQKKKTSKNCRLAFASPLVQETGFVQLSRNTEGKVIPIEPHERESKTFNRNRDEDKLIGITPRDTRTIMVPTKRREICIADPIVENFEEIEKLIVVDLKQELITEDT